jgi:hypothetical protein
MAARVVIVPAAERFPFPCVQFFSHGPAKAFHFFPERRIVPQKTLGEIDSSQGNAHHGLDPAINDRDELRTTAADIDHQGRRKRVFLIPLAL